MSEQFDSSSSSDSGASDTSSTQIDESSQLPSDLPITPEPPPVQPPLRPPEPGGPTPWIPQEGAPELPPLDPFNFDDPGFDPPAPLLPPE